jgi:hypothetical protein
MIKEAEFKDIIPVSVMLHLMYKEVFGDDTVDNLDVYIKEVMTLFLDDKQTILIDSKYRGFFIVTDISEPMLKTPRYQGTRVYIRPDYRKSKLLKEFYDELFKRFDKGIILGQTEITSEHIKVMDKRHNLVAKVYELNRR